MTVKELKEQINALHGQIATIELAAINYNTPILIEEVRNLIDGVGNYHWDDEHNIAIYYSNIPGIEDFAIHINYDMGKKSYQLWVNVKSPAGFLLPSNIGIDGIKYELVICKTSDYSEKMDYQYEGVKSNNRRWLGITPSHLH